MSNIICKALLENDKLVELVSFVFKHTKNNETKRQVLVDYGRTCKGAQIKLDYNKYKEDHYSGGLMIGNEYYSFYRSETPSVVWDWCLDYYKRLAKFGMDERFPLGFRQVAGYLAGIPYDGNIIVTYPELDILIKRYLNNN